MTNWTGCCASALDVLLGLKKRRWLTLRRRNRIECYRIASGLCHHGFVDNLVPKAVRISHFVSLSILDISTEAAAATILQYQILVVTKTSSPVPSDTCWSLLSTPRHLSLSPDIC